MAHNRPWYKRSGADFVMGAMVLPDNDCRWAYSVIVDMLNDHDRALPDDAGFMCGLCSLSRRKWPVVRKALIDHGKVIEVDGYLTNPRFEREKAERDADRQRSVEAGREGGRKSAAKRAANQDELPLSPPLTGDKPDFNGTLSQDNSGHKKPRRLKTNGKIEPPPQPSRAREEARVKEIPTPTSSMNLPSERAQRADDDDDADNHSDDVATLTALCCDAAGMTARCASRPDLRASSQSIVSGWIAAGVDIRKSAVPIIERITAADPAPTHSLNRFAPAIDTDLKRKRNAKPKPQVQPVFQFDDEAPPMAELRTAFASVSPSYPDWCRYIRFTIDDHLADGDGKVLTLAKRGQGDWRYTPQAVLDANRAKFEKLAQNILGVQLVWWR